MVEQWSHVLSQLLPPAKVADNLITIEKIFGPEKCDARSNKAESKKQIDLVGKRQSAI